MEPAKNQQKKPSPTALVTTKKHVPIRDFDSRLKLQEENQIAKELEKLGIFLKSDPLNAFTDHPDPQYELGEDQDDEDEGISSFTGHHLSYKSKLDAFERNKSRCMFDPIDFSLDNPSAKKEKKNVLKELGCRLKSLVYQKNEVSRKDILDMFRKSEVHLGKRKPKSNKFGN